MAENTPTWWQKLRTWFLCNIGKVYLHTKSVLHSCVGKPCFKDLYAKEASVHEAGPVVLELRQRLSHWALNSTAALAFDGTRMDLVGNGTSTCCTAYALFLNACPNAGCTTRGNTRLVAHCMRRALRMRMCYVFSLPPLVLKSLFLVSSPLPSNLVAIVWRVSTLAVAKHNAPYTTPLPNENCKLVMTLASDVEQQHGGSCKRLRQQFNSTEPTEALTRYRKRVRQDEAFVNASKSTKANSTPSTEPPQQRRSGRRIVTPARFLD